MDQYSLFVMDDVPQKISWDCGKAATSPEETYARLGANS
jgi:hypothetical protein